MIRDGVDGVAGAVNPVSRKRRSISACHSASSGDGTDLRDPGVRVDSGSAELERKRLGRLGLALRDDVSDDESSDWGSGWILRTPLSAGAEYFRPFDEGRIVSRGGGSVAFFAGEARSDSIG